MNKKGMTLNEFGGLALAFVLVAIVIAIGSTVLIGVQKNQCTTGAVWNATINDCNLAETTLASNITKSALSGSDTMGDWLPTIAVIVAAAVVIGVIVKYFNA